MELTDLFFIVVGVLIVLTFNQLQERIDILESRINTLIGDRYDY